MMYQGGREQQQQYGDGSGARQMTQRLQEERQEKEQLAWKLQQEAMHQWQKAVEGMVALPAALVLGVASSTMYVVGFLARGFEVFQAYSQDMQRGQQEGYQGRFEAQGREGRGIYAGQAGYERQPGISGREGQPGWSAGVSAGVSTGSNERPGEHTAEGNVTPPNLPRA